MNTIRALAVLSLPALLALPARAVDMAFVEASSELNEGRSATNAYNAVDDKETTAWCTAKSGGEGAYLSFGFARPVTVTHLGIVVGAMKGDALDKSKKRARVVQIADVNHRVEAVFKDEPGLQLVELSQPAKGTRIVVEFPSVHDATSPDAPLCVTEVVLRHNSRALTGERVVTKQRALNAPARRLAREWIDDVAAPQRTLLFNVDGTFTYQYEPFLEGKPARVRGKWTAANRSITLTIGDKSYRVPSRLTKIDDDEKKTVELVLSGEPPHPSMVGAFRPAPAKLP